MVKPGPKMVRPLAHTPNDQSPNPQPAFFTEGESEEKKGQVRAVVAGAASLGLRPPPSAVAPAPSASLRGSLRVTPLTHGHKNPRAAVRAPTSHRRKQAAPLSWNTPL